jgi:hypothetical protein
MLKYFTMTDACWQAEFLETKNELQRLKECMSMGTPTVHKGLSLISVIPKWSGSDSTVTLKEFFASIESSARIGNWQDNDQREIAVLRLTGSAKLFYQGCTKLHEAGVTWQTFKVAFRHRYKDVHMDQYHFTRLQTARQRKNESPQEFADRCRTLAQKVMVKVDDPQIQHVHRENANCMLLASFVSGLEGVASCQTRFCNPQTLEDALKIVLSMQETEKLEQFNESFYTRFDKLVCLLSRSPDRSRSGNENQRQTTDSQAVNHLRSQRVGTPGKVGRSETARLRSVRTGAALCCYECQGIGHCARECLTRQKREAKVSDLSGKRKPTERSERSCPRGDKPPLVNK